jgi:hypothetical protein
MEVNNCWNCSPGFALSQGLIREDHTHGLDVFFSKITLGLAIDSFLWFVIIGGVAFAVNATRKKRRGSRNK